MSRSGRGHADRQPFNLQAVKIEHLARAADDLDLVEGSCGVAVKDDGLVQVFAHDLTDGFFGAVSQVDSDAVISTIMSERSESSSTLRLK